METTGDCSDTDYLKYSEVDYQRPVATMETAGTTGDLKYSEVDC